MDRKEFGEYVESVQVMQTLLGREAILRNNPFIGSGVIYSLKINYEHCVVNLTIFNNIDAKIVIDVFKFNNERGEFLSRKDIKEIHNSFKLAVGEISVSEKSISTIYSFYGNFKTIFELHKYLDKRLESYFLK